MKKKYFFGLFICLVLLCSGVFLLDANSNSININDYLINENITSAYNNELYFDAVYGYSTAGVSFKATIGYTNNQGTEFKETTASYTFQTSTAPSESKYISANPANWGSYRYRRITFTDFGTPSSGLLFSHNGYNAQVKWRADFDNRDDMPDTYNNFKNFQTKSNEVGAGTGVTWHFSIYWIVELKLDENGGTQINNNVYYSTKETTLTTSVTKPTRTGYNFAGYYTEKNGGQQWIDANGAVNKTNLTQSKARPKTLYAHWTPKTYQIDTNILSPNDEQDYKSGTMTQSYNGQTIGGLTDQAFSNITADTTLTISGINPATGMYVSSITVNRGTISVTKSNGLITGCTYTVSPKILGEPSNSWDAIISINMDYKDYDVTIKDGDEAVSNLADMTWINGATFNGTTYTYNANGITSTYNTATGDFKINGTPTNSFSILTCLGLTLTKMDCLYLKYVTKMEIIFLLVNITT